MGKIQIQDEHILTVRGVRCRTIGIITISDHWPLLPFILSGMMVIADAVIRITGDSAIILIRAIMWG